MQMKRMHIYDFTGWVTGPPLVAAFSYQHKTTLHLFLVKQIPFFKPWMEQSINYESADVS